jgi:hypothetical protein
MEVGNKHTQKPDHRTSEEQEEEEQEQDVDLSASTRRETIPWIRGFYNIEVYFMISKFIPATLDFSRLFLNLSDLWQRYWWQLPRLRLLLCEASFLGRCHTTTSPRCPSSYSSSTLRQQLFEQRWALLGSDEVFSQTAIPRQTRKTLFACLSDIRSKPPRSQSASTSRVSRSSPLFSHRRLTIDTRSPIIQYFNIQKSETS